MNETQVLKQARAAGMRVGIDGDTLVLEADRAPSSELLDRLVRYKPDIIKLLQSRDDGWSGDGWQNYFEETARKAEVGGGLARAEAQERAFNCCVGEWLRRNPVRSFPGLCELCGQSGGLLQPYLTDCSVEDPGHTWLHQSCSIAWDQKRFAIAEAALLSVLAIR